MNRETYDGIKAWLLRKELPPNAGSNFARNVKLYEVNQKGFLTRGGKLVLLEQDLPQVWSKIHGHSGRDKTIAKFRKW